MAASATAASRTSAGSIVGAVILPVAALLISLAIWFAFPQDNHYFALSTIGSVSLIFALVSYFGRAFTQAGAALQSLSWGFAGLGFALIVGSLLLGGSYLGIVLELVYLFIVVILIGAWAFLVVWRRGSLQAVQKTEAHRESWRASTPASAFDYTTARPNLPPTAPPPAEGNAPSPPPGASR
jgi:O-antigen/teichoic acid export membrane protein